FVQVLYTQPNILGRAYQRSPRGISRRARLGNPSSDGVFLPLFSLRQGTRLLWRTLRVSATLLENSIHFGIVENPGTSLSSATLHQITIVPQKFTGVHQGRS